MFSGRFWNRMRIADLKNGEMEFGRIFIGGREGDKYGMDTDEYSIKM